MSIPYMAKKVMFSALSKFSGQNNPLGDFLASKYRASIYM